MFGGRGRFALRRRRRARRDDAGSMPLALLVTLVGVTLSAGLSGVVVGQIKESQRAADRVAAVTAAQAGLDAGLARIRSSMTALSGDLTKLPCTVITDTLTPRAGSGTATAAYRLSIGYFLVDPSGLTNTLRPVGDLTNLSQPLDALLNGVGQSLTTAAKASLTSAVQGAVGCVNGVVKQVPLYGLLRSTGTVGDTTRTLYATYTFHTTEETIPGGHIVIAGTNGQLCLGGGIRADGKAPQSGDPVLAVPCTGADEQIKFIYPRNLNLSLSKSRTTKQAGAPYGMCVTAAVQVDNAPVTFAPCVSPKAVSQQWSYEVNQQTYYGTLNGTTSSTYCLTMSQAGVVNSPIVLKRNNSNCGTSGRAYKAFVPEASVGSGAAGINTGQLVNFQEVGRCLDLTEEDPKGGYFTSRKAAPALITYPCKQSFDGKVFWNHAWRSPVIPAGEYLAKGQISTVPDKGTYAGIPYCLNSPGAAGGYVWVEPCSTGTPALEWTVYGPAPLATEAYQVVDMYGNCLQAAGSLGSAHQYKGWSLVIATACNGSGVQKWNKPNSLGLGPLTGIQER